MRQRQKVSWIIQAHEEAGNLGCEHHLYKDAAQRYQLALNVSAISPEDQLRISEKLSTALFLGENPNVANPWIKQFSLLHLRNVPEKARALELLHQQVRQMWTDYKVEEALPFIDEAVRIAETIDDPYFRKMAYLRMADNFHRLGRFKDSERYLDAVGGVDDNDNAALRAYYHLQKAILASGFGNATVAFENFDRAVQAANDDTDIYRLTSIWENYGIRATALGSTDLAKNCIERALLIARQNQILWRIPYLCLSYAGLLMRMGKYEVAYEYLRDALSYDTRIPVLDGIFAEVGIPLALHLNDETILTKCARPLTVKTVFRSHISGEIGPVATAFAQLYAYQGNTHKAQYLLHRTLKAVTNVDFSWDLPLEIARRGAYADVPRARNLLEIRTTLPCADVSKAYLSLFDAFIAQRHNQFELTQHHAAEAMKKFEILHWYRYTDLARTLLPNTTPRIFEETLSTFSRIPDLTAREQQVVELVLKGRTNREVAHELAIREHTVEKHMSSIMNRLGIRSRHQLVDVIAEQSHHLGAV